MRNIQTINKLISRELSINEELVESVNSFYWKEVRRKLSSLESTSVSIKHIGTITTSKRKIDWFIRSTIAKIRNIKKGVRYKESTKALLLEVNYDKLKKALKQRNELATQYYEAYIKRTKRILPIDADSPPPEFPNFRGNNNGSEERLEHLTRG